MKTKRIGLMIARANIYSATLEYRTWHPDYSYLLSDILQGI